MKRKGAKQRRQKNCCRIECRLLPHNTEQMADVVSVIADQPCYISIRSLVVHCASSVRSSSRVMDHQQSNYR